MTLGLCCCPITPIGLIVRDYFESSLNAITPFFCVSSVIVSYERVLISPYPDILPDVVGRNR
jgi:hypothetical protein